MTIPNEKCTNRPGCPCVFCVEARTTESAREEQGFLTLEDIAEILKCSRMVHGWVAEACGPLDCGSARKTDWKSAYRRQVRMGSRIPESLAGRCRRLLRRYVSRY